MNAAQADNLILVVDDDLDICETVASLLESQGYRVAEARNGAEALEIIDASVPAVVLLDLRMPVMGGIECLQKLRSRAHCAGVEVVLMSALVEIEAKCAELKIRWRLGKPFDVGQLFAAVEGAMARR